MEINDTENLLNQSYEQYRNPPDIHSRLDKMKQDIINSVCISRAVTENYPHFAYWCENKHGFKADDIITHAPGEMPRDQDIYIVKDVIDDYTFCTNRGVPMPVNKLFRKLTTVAAITSKLKGVDIEKDNHESDVRTRMRGLFLNEAFAGTIEERLMDGYLYILSHEDLTLSEEERSKTRPRGQKGVMAHTGKAGVLVYIESGKRNNLKEEAIARNIWIEMIVEGVKLYVNIKNLKITKKDGNKSIQDTTE